MSKLEISGGLARAVCCHFHCFLISSLYLPDFKALVYFHHIRIPVSGLVTVSAFKSTFSSNAFKPPFVFAESFLFYLEMQYHGIGHHSLPQSFITRWMKESYEPAHTILMHGVNISPKHHRTYLALWVYEKEEWMVNVDKLFTYVQISMWTCCS